jgi:hypothetical protein
MLSPFLRGAALGGAPWLEVVSGTTRAVAFTVRGQTTIPAGDLREAELTWYSIGEARRHRR